MATRAISEALLGKPDGSEAELPEAAAKATPEQLLALKTAEQDFAVKMRELDIDLERIANADRDSARNREVATKDWTPRNPSVGGGDSGGTPAVSTDPAPTAA